MPLRYTYFSDHRSYPVKTTPKIRITCDVEHYLPLHSLEIFQGDLKSRTIEDYRKIKASILKHGIVVPFFIWRHKDHHWVIDGTGRVETLCLMEEGEGYAIPELPVVFIKAKDEAETALQNSSVKNNIILDPFAGSGSTLIAAQDCKRQARLIEIDPHYCDVIVKRAIEAYPALKVTRERDGEAQNVTIGDFSDENQTKKR